VQLPDTGPADAQLLVAGLLANSRHQGSRRILPRLESTPVSASRNHRTLPSGAPLSAESMHFSRTSTPIRSCIDPHAIRHGACLSSASQTAWSRSCIDPHALRHGACLSSAPQPAWPRPAAGILSLDAQVATTAVATSSCCLHPSVRTRAWQPRLGSTPHSTTTCGPTTSSTHG